MCAKFHAKIIIFPGIIPPIRGEPSKTPSLMGLNTIFASAASVN